MPTPRTDDFDIRFLAGMESQSEPGMLGEDYYSRGMNITNRGGLVQCRPGYRCKLGHRLIFFLELPFQAGATAATQSDQAHTT